jgi:hypothetical protein
MSNAHDPRALKATDAEIAPEELNSTTLKEDATVRGREWLSRSSFVHEDARRGIDRMAKA